MTRCLLDRDVLGAFKNPHGNRNVRAWIGPVPDEALYVGAVTVMKARKVFARVRTKARADAERAGFQGYEADFIELLDASPTASSQPTATPTS